MKRGAFFCPTFHTLPLLATTSALSDVQTTAAADVCLPELRRVHCCEWQDWFSSSGFIYIFLLFSQHRTLYFFLHAECKCVCVSVLLQGREGEACLFQGTPPELMFHTCAQRGTLYRASQVHCINCGRNHFIGGRRGAAAVVVVVVERGSSCTSSSSSLAHIQSLNIHI